jgi:micrococcal nuclease
MRSRQPEAPLALVTVAALVVGGCAGAIAASPPAGSGHSAATWSVSEVVDGDTIRVTMPTADETVRLIGINAPEGGECWADAATQALAGFLAVSEVILERDVSDRDRYGRLLRYVVTRDGADVGGLLIDGGHAWARSYPPDTSRDTAYRERQDLAQQAGLGLWAPDACGAATASIDPSSIHIEIHPDAAGDDSRNLNDEWVRFVNLDGRDLDLEGWMVRDESSSHRYRFEALVLAPGASVTLRSGCGTDSDTERYWCVTGSAVWNNGGDTVLLLDPLGNVVTQRRYP